MSDASFPEDPSFPQLQIATDPKLMQEVFQRYLQPLDGRSYQVRECRISHTRYRRAIRCMLQYTLDLAEPDTGREWSQLVTGTMYAEGRTRQIWEEMRRSNQGRGALNTSPTFAPFRWIREKLRASEPIPEISPDPSSLAFAPFFYIPDLDMVVQVFPYDRRLPALPLLMEGSLPELEPLLLDRFGLGEWQAEVWDIEPVRYLAEKRATLRLTVRARDTATGRADEKRFYAKVYNDEETGEQTYEVLRALWEKASAGGAEVFTVGRPIVYLSDFRTLIQEETTGTSLRDILRREDEAIPVVRKVARALASLHLDHLATPRRHHLQDELANLKRTGKSLQRACPHLGPEIEKIVDNIVTGLEEVPPAPTHGDLKPDHILLDGNRLALLDLDGFAGADPVLDVARLLVSLAKVTPRSRLSHNRTREVAQAFVEEYFAHVPEAWRARLPLRYAGAVLGVAGGVLRHQAPSWPDRIEALVEEAKDSLAGRVW